MASMQQNNKFAVDVVGKYLLDDAIDWIKSNLDPEDVFSEKQLSAWAEDNGYVFDTEN